MTHIYIKSTSNQRSTTSRAASAAGRLRPNSVPGRVNLRVERAVSLAPILYPVVGGSETALFAQVWCNNFVHEKTGIPQIVRHRLAVLSEAPGAYSILSSAPTVQLLEQVVFTPSHRFAYRNRLLDFVEHCGNRI